MQKLLFVILVLGMMSACSYRSGKSLRAYLQDTEQVMKSVSPDSAYRRLAQLADDDFQSLDDYYYYYLLCMETKMWGGASLSDTLVMNRMVRYYQERGDSLMQARANLVLGFVYTHSNKLESAKYSNMVIDYAKRIGDKSLQAAGYYQFVRACRYFGYMNDYRLQEGKEMLADAERLARESNDTLILMNILWDSAHLYENAKQWQEMERVLLEAFRLAVLDCQPDAARIAIELSHFYGKDGRQMPDKAFHYSMCNLELRQDKLSERTYCFFMASAYRNIGKEDSARYYKQKAEEFPQEMFEELNLYNFQPVLFPFEEKDGKLDSWFYVCVGLLLVALVGGGCYWGVRHSRKVSAMQQELDILSSQTPAVYEKIGQIVRDHLFKDGSDLQMVEADWRMLQVETDKQWNGIIRRLQKEYCLTDMEIRLFCLNLMELPTSHMPFLFDRSRSTIYNKNRDLLAKLSIERTSATFKEDLKQFLEKEK